MRPQVGQIINNKYRVLRVIGDGGMGSVYEARHEVLGSTVALKFLHPELSRRAGLVQRFLQEARVSAKIQSPHVVRVTDVDQTSAGLAFIVLEYLEGRTLQTLYEDLYRAGQRLSYADALEYAMQMLEGVEAAHKEGIVHRDLKPDNVMITKTSKGATLLKLLDFGIAKLKVTGELDKGLTRPGVIMGTPEYMAPEQAYSADAVDARADIFSLGVMIFEMLAGRRPVGGDDPQQIASAYLSGRVSRLTDLVPDIAPELAAAVHKAMSPLAKDRFASVAEMREAIEPFAHAVRPVLPSRSSLSGAQTPTPAPAVSPVPAGGSPAPGEGRGAPPATNVGDEGYRPVAKTLPPEAEPGAPAAEAPVPHAPSIPVHMGTPIGFSNPPAVATGVPVLEPSAPPPAPARRPVPATVSSAPYVPPGHGATVPVEAPLPQEEMPARPGGTAMGASPYHAGGGGTAMDAPAYGTDPGVGGSAGTASMNPYQPPFLGGGTVEPAPPRRGRSGVATLFGILALAGGVAGAVVGGLYLAHDFANRSADAKDDPPLPTVAPVAPTTDPTSPDPPQPPVIPITPATTHPVIHTQPPPHPASSGTGPGPSPSSHPSATPTFPGLPPFTIPSGFPSLPFPIPGLGPPQQPSQPSQPSQPPGQQPGQPTQPTQPGQPGQPPKRPLIVIQVPKGGH